VITDSAKSEAEKFLGEKCGPNGSHAVLCEECVRLRRENEELRQVIWKIWSHLDLCKIDLKPKHL
jgi:hypothetical protein